MSDQDIDKLFSEGLSNTSLPFNEGAWASAEKAIIAHEAAKRRRWIIIWFFAGLMLISGGIGLYNFKYNSSTEDLASKNSIQSSTYKNNASTKTSSTQDDGKNSSQQNSNMPENSEPLNNSSDEKPEVKSESNNLADGNSGGLNTFINPDEDKTNPESEISDNSLSEKANFNFESNNIADGNTAVVSPLVLTEEDSKAPNTITESNQVMEIFGMTLLPIHPAQAYDINSTNAPNGKIGKAADWKLPAHWDTKVNIIAGALPLDYTTSENEINRLPYYAGIGVSKIHNYSWEYGVTLLMEELIYSPNEKVIEQVEYGFGRATTRHSISRNRGSYLSIPLYAKYRIKNNHALMFGLQYSRLMQSFSTYSVKRENELGISTTLEDQNNVSGFNNDLSRNQASLIMGYDLTLSDRLRFQMMGRIGANSLYKNTIQDNPFEDRIHLRIGIEYSIWRF